MNKTIVATVIIGTIAASAIFAVKYKSYSSTRRVTQTVDQRTLSAHPLSIKTMREKKYPGSQLSIEQTLSDASNYHQYIASYRSEGLKIFGLLTVPIGQAPADGWPVIIFNHGYIAPATYKTTERYVAYVDMFARNGYVVFKPDYRGHGDSEGQPEGAYYSPAYTTDVLNALASIKQYANIDPNSIGMWGHSMGGNIILRSLVINPKDIKAAVSWGGVVGTYNDLVNNWHRRAPLGLSEREQTFRSTYRRRLTDTYGTPMSNPTFWNSVDPTHFLADITAPLQLHAGEADEEVPPTFSASLYDKLKSLNKRVEYYNYPEGNHNISGSAFTLAMKRTVEFFDTHLKP